MLTKLIARLTLATGNSNEANNSTIFIVPNSKYTASRYLQFTVTMTEAVTLLTLFSAVHQYSPSWCLLMLFNGRRDPGCFHSLFPRFDHVTVGVGLPVALQNNVTSSVSLNVWFLKIAMLGLAIKLKVETADYQILF